MTECPECEKYIGRCPACGSKRPLPVRRVVVNSYHIRRIRGLFHWGYVYEIVDQSGEVLDGDYWTSDGRHPGYNTPEEAKAAMQENLKYRQSQMGSEE